MMWPRARADAEVFDTALGGHGPHSGDIADLARLAGSLHRVAADPSPDFVTGLRAQLMTEAPNVLVARATPPTTPPRRARKRLVAAAVGAITVAGAFGIVTTSAQALPGDMLYPVKRGVETVQLSLHHNDVSRAEFELDQATRRLAEAQSLAETDNPHSNALVAKSLTDFAAKASAGSQSLFEDFSVGGNRASINKIAAFATSANAKLTALTNNLPQDSTDEFKIAAATVNSMISQASSVCDECKSAELSDLAAKVQAAVGPVKHKPAAARTTKTPSQLPTPTKPAASTPGPSTFVPPVIKPLVTSPLVAPPVATTPPIDLGDATKPIVGTLLGDDDQTGLIPGLLGGLLGSN